MKADTTDFGAENRKEILRNALFIGGLLGIVVASHTAAVAISRSTGYQIGQCAVAVVALAAWGVVGGRIIYRLSAHGLVIAAIGGAISGALLCLAVSLGILRFP